MNYKEMDRLISESFNELMEHLMQDMVNSVHIKNLKNKLTAMKDINETSRVTSETIIPMAQQTTPRRVIERGTVSNTNKADVLKMAFALSKFDFNFFNNIFGISLNQGEIFKMVSAIYDFKTSTLRNYRDAFDHHIKQVYSNRTGWDTEKLAPDLQAVKDMYNHMSEEELTAEIKKTLASARPDIDLLVKVAYGFLFAKKAVKTTLNITYNNHKFEIIIAAYPDRVAYMVFTGFGNTLTEGIYPAIYVYRKFGKIFTVFGESESNAPVDAWKMENANYRKIKDCFSDDALEEIRKYTNSYLDNYVYNAYAFEKDAEAYGGYKLELAQQVITDLKALLGKYVTQYSSK